MKKYALLIGLLWCFVSCSTDELDNDVQNHLKTIEQENDPKKSNWDKDKYGDDNENNNGN